MKAIIFDTETTGLLLPSAAPLEKQPKIIEIGALLVDGETILAELSQLIDPGEDISAEITKITGITDADLVGMPTFKDALPVLWPFFEGADALIAHNASFDAGMLRNELKRVGREDFPWPPKTICTVQEFVHVFGYRPNLKKLYERYTGNALQQTHRAIEDCRALHEALIAADFFSKIGG